MTQVKRNKTTIFEQPENKPIKKVFNRSSNGGREPLPKALQENNIGSILKEQYNPKPLNEKGAENVRDASADRPKKKINQDRLISGVVNGLNFAQMYPKREQKQTMR